MFQRMMLTTCGALLALSAHAGEVYKMVDKSGNVHYSDQQQPGWTRVEPLKNVPSGTPSDQEATPEEQAKREAACKEHRDNLARYKSAATIKETDSLGREHIYTPEEKQLLIDRTQKQADESCVGMPTAG